MVFRIFTMLSSAIIFFNIYDIIDHKTNKDGVSQWRGQQQLRLILRL